MRLARPRPHSTVDQEAPPTADTYTIAAAARLCHVDRRTLQRAIRRGTLHLDADHCLSREDLLLAGYLVADTPLATPQDIPPVTPQDIPLATPLLSMVERLTVAVEGIWYELQRLRPAAPAPQAMPLSTPQSVPQAAPQVTPRHAPRGTPQPARGTPDVDAAVARMRTLQGEGLSLAQIAARLTQEDYRTLHGRPWSKSTVSYVLRTHGR